MSFESASYASHQQVKHDSDLVKTWRASRTVDYWRHERMYSQLASLLTAYPKSRWLTIGDGRYGTDAHYLIQMGASVVASDINETYLKQAKEEGFISEYAIENAEKLSYQDNEFDFVLCKESYHHFPRPMIALYEMLRVCKKAVILIEPNDQSIVNTYSMGLKSAAFWFTFALKQRIKKILGKAQNHFPVHYEPTGNYVYSISARELEKAALGLNLEALAFKGLNDYYVHGVEYEDFNQNGPLFKKVKENLKQANAISKQRPESFGLLIAMIFKTPPDAACVSFLKRDRFDVRILGKNPYIKH